MPKQYGSAGSNGIFATSGGLQQQQTDLWAREMPYWQKFMKAGSYFDDFGMVRLSPSVPQDSFFQFLMGLTSEESALNMPVVKKPSNRKRKDGDRSSTGGVAKNNPVIADFISAYPKEPPIYGRVHTLPEEMPARYGQGYLTPIENTAIYQSYQDTYLNQQINNYLYRMEYVQQENYSHQTLVSVADKKQRKLRYENQRGGYPQRQKAPISSTVAMEGASPAMGKMPAEKNDIAQLAVVSDGAREPAFPGQPQPLEVMPIYGVGAENRPDWMELCALLRQSMAETFTELLQNMIPETEGR